MAFQAAPDCAQAFIQWTVNGALCGHTHVFKKTGGYTQTDLMNLAADLDSWVHTEWKPIASNQAHYDKVVVRGLAHEEDYVVENNTHAGNGSAVTNPLTVNTTWAAKRLSGFTGRSARGRIYVVGLGTTVLSSDENRMNATTITNILAALLEIATYAVTHGWVEVILSRWHNNVKRSTAIAFDVVDWSFTDDIMDTQRRRLPGL